ncbi:MAG: GIN domain-containing protein [Candidatus Sumerlaeia bacterium]
MKYSFACVLLLMLLASGCSRQETVVRGSGEAIRLEYDIDAPRSVKFGDVGDLFVRFGKEAKLVVEIEENLSRYVYATPDGDSLSLGILSELAIQNTRPIRFMLDLPSLEAISISGPSLANVGPWKSSTVISCDASEGAQLLLEKIEAPEAIMKVSGISRVEIDMLQLEKFQIHQQTATDVWCKKGFAKKLDLRIKGSSLFRGAMVEFGLVGVTAQNKAQAQLGPVQYLEGSVSDSSLVEYRGKPSLIVESRGGGRVRPMAVGGN